MSITLLQLIVRSAESSASDAATSAQTAAADTPPSSSQIAQHNINSTKHDTATQSLQASTISDPSLRQLPAAHAAYSAHAAASSAHSAAASALLASQSKSEKTTPTLAASVAHQVSASQHKIDSQKHADAALVLQSEIARAASDQKLILASAVNAHLHAAAANTIAAAQHTAAASSPPPLSAPAIDQIRIAAFQIFTQRKDQSPQELEQAGDWYQAKSNALANLVRDLQKKYSIAIADPDGQL
ncbi:MAG: hypothetical protein ABSF29_07285 [Tepidisphaeraceae bacterium]|jgi:hypothetical protein